MSPGTIVSVDVTSLFVWIPNCSHQNCSLGIFISFCDLSLNTAPTAPSSTRKSPSERRIKSSPVSHELDSHSPRRHSHSTSMLPNCSVQLSSFQVTTSAIGLKKPQENCLKKVCQVQRVGWGAKTHTLVAWNWQIWRSPFFDTHTYDNMTRYDIT